MEDAAERKKRLKLMRDEASAASTSEHGSTSLANPLIEQPEQHPSSTKAFSFYSDPLASVQSHLSASRHPQRHPSSINLSHAAPVHGALPPRPSTVGQQMPNTWNGPPVPQQGGLQQPWGQPPPHAHQVPQPNIHIQPGGHLPMHGFPAAPFQGSGTQQYPSWQGPPRGPPPPQGSHAVRPQGPRPPSGPPPGIRPAGSGMSGQGPPGRGRQGQERGLARGRGRGRGRTSGGAGSCDNIEAYVSPAMLQDPWASLMKQHQQAAPVEQPRVPVDDAGSLGSTAAHSMSDMFDAVEQEAQALSQGRLAEEGMQDRPWH